MYSGKNKLLIERYLDLDWAKDKNSQKSRFDFIFILNGESVSWCLKKQPIMALLSIKAQYIALTLTTKEAMWLRFLLKKLGLL